MTLTDKIALAAMLNSRLRMARDRLGEALGAMDYSAALQHQIEIHDLERELRNLDENPYLPVGAASRWMPANSNFRLRYDDGADR